MILDGTKLSVNYASAADRLVVLARGDAGVDLYLVDPTAAGVTLTHYKSQSGEPHYKVDFDGVRVPRRGPRGRPGQRLGDLRGRAAPGHHPARRPGDRGRRALPRGDRRLREHAHPVRQAPRCLPGAGPLHGRRLHEDRRRSRAGARGGLERGPGPLHLALRADGEALLHPRLPADHEVVRADLGRRRVHDRVRHPDVLPAREGAPALLVGHALPRGARREGRGSTADLRPTRAGSSRRG